MTTSTKILIVEDQADLLEQLELTLMAADYQVFTARHGVEALALLKIKTVDLILADIAMPEMNGYELYEQVRKNSQWLRIPFIFLTARSLDSDIRYGKQMGVDDYLVKPIEAKDLLATVQGKLRRAQELSQLTVSASSSESETKAGESSTPTSGNIVEASKGGSTLVVGILTIDQESHRVWRGEIEVYLSATEFRLLYYMVQEASHIHSSQDLIKATHDIETESNEAGNLIRPIIRSIRRKLGYEVGDMGCIENVRGVGYRLNPP